MKTFILILGFSLFSQPALSSSGCQATLNAHLKNLKSSSDPELRSEAGRCLMSRFLSRAEVSQLILKIIRDNQEDVLLREDLVQAFAESPLRRTIKVEEELIPELDKEEQAAVNRTLAGSESLLAFTRAVKSMDEIIPITQYEREFFRALSEIALEDSNPVILRSTAVSALEAASRKVVDSGVYDDRALRMAHETLNTVALRDDNSSYFSGAASAYLRLADAGVPHFIRPQAIEAGRVIASEKVQ